MLDQSLLQSHFIGRDGFRWWIGQIPPIESWQDQANLEGWGQRCKVRILGYHPLDEESLSNDDLPWALIMLPTTSGSGASNYAVNPKLRPGDNVIGFFLDGDNAQTPVIMGTIGRTDQYSSDNYKNPFSPFTGYTSNISNPKSTGRQYDNETNEATQTSQQSPRAVPPEVAKRLGEISSFTGIGKEIVFADTTENTSIKTVKTEVNNLLKIIQEAQGKISEYKQAIQNTAEVIKTSINWLVGKMMESIYNFLVGSEEEPGIIPLGLQALYATVYGAVFAATGSPSAAHTAGYKSNEVFVTPIKILEKALSCVTNAIVEGLKDLIVELLESLLENVQNFVSCAAEQFVGSLVNSMVDQIANGLSSALDGVSGLLSGVFSVVDFLSSTVDAIKGLGGLFDCNQNNTKGDGTKEWIIGTGPKNSLNSNNSFNNILNIANSVGSLVSSLSETPAQLEQIVGSVTGIVNVFGNNSLLQNSIGQCFTGFPTSCESPKINIFGGGGIGGSAVPIFGSVIQNTLFNNVTETSSIIGAIITNPGSGYRFPPFVEIVDNCGLGYGAKGTAIIDNEGKITSIYITSSGEGYPRLADQDPYGVVDVAVPSSGLNYSSDDFGIDNLGNTYSLTIDNGIILSATPINIKESSSLPIIKINSKNGFGAVLKPILGPIIPKTTEIKKQIDCPI